MITPAKAQKELSRLRQMKYLLLLPCSKLLQHLASYSTANYGIGFPNENFNKKPNNTERSPKKAKLIV